MKANSLFQDTWGIGAVYGILRKLGLTADNEGFFYTSYAVCLAVLEPARLILAAKWLYPDVAKHYKTDEHHVQRSIQIVVNTVWCSSRRKLEQIARYRLTYEPTASQFIAIIAAHFSHKKSA